MAAPAGSATSPSSWPRPKGATVFTTASEHDLDFVRELGADMAIDDKNERFEDVTSDIDLVFDLIGGETQDRADHRLAF